MALFKGLKHLTRRGKNLLIKEKNNMIAIALSNYDNVSDCSQSTPLSTLARNSVSHNVPSLH